MGKKGSTFALGMALFGLAVILALGGYRYATEQEEFKAVLCACVAALYGLWILSEFRVAVGETGKDSADDKGTCEAYAIGRLLTVLCALGFESLWRSPGAWLPLGMLFFGGGIALRSYAILTLDKCYSHRVRAPQANTIIADGPYRYLRHPAYAGMLLAHAGILILFFNWFLLLAFFGIFIPVLVRRIRVEESYLLQMPEYRAFATGRARLAPGIW